MEIYYTSKFRREYNKLPLKVKRVAEEREFVFRNNPFDSQLNTHKLHGKYKEYWAFAIAEQYRIIFAFSESNIIDFIDIGTHKIYR